MAKVKRLQHASVPMPPDGSDRARAFYGDVLGMKEIDPRPSGLAHLTLVWFEAGDGGDEIHCFADSGHGNNDRQHLCLEVDDVEAYRARCKDHGVQVDDTEEIINRPRFFVSDPFGNRLEITQILGQFQ